MPATTLVDIPSVSEKLAKKPAGTCPVLEYRICVSHSVGTSPTVEDTGTEFQL